MSMDSSPPSPNLSELMQFYKIAALDEKPQVTETPDHAPVKVSTTRKPTDRTAGIVRGDLYAPKAYRVQPRTNGWNSSTQLAQTTGKPLKYQILCRNFVPPPPPVAVDRKKTEQLLQRLSKTTISSRMKGATAVNPAMSTEEIDVEVGRKRLHLQQKHATSKQQKSTSQSPLNCPSSSRDGIELLLFYRKEVEKRLRADPLYTLHQDFQA